MNCGRQAWELRWLEYFAEDSIHRLTTRRYECIFQLLRYLLTAGLRSDDVQQQMGLTR